MKFKFVGAEPSEFFGFFWSCGVVHDVTDDHAIRKLSNSVLFEAVESAPVAELPKGEPPVEQETKEKFEDYVQQPKRRGRAPKVNDGDAN